MEKYKDAITNYQKFMSLKEKNNENDDMTTFANTRIKELEDYLSKLNEK